MHGHIHRVPARDTLSIAPRSQHGMAPLHYAVSFGHSDCVRVLLANGADCEIVARLDGLTPLVLSAKLENLVIMRVLIDHHADISAQDRHGTRALEWAARNNQPEMISLLLEARDAAAAEALCTATDTEVLVSALTIALRSGVADSVAAILKYLSELILPGDLAEIIDDDDQRRGGLRALLSAYSMLPPDALARCVASAFKVRLAAGGPPLGAGTWHARCCGAHAVALRPPPMMRIGRLPHAHALPRGRSLLSRASVSRACALGAAVRQAWPCNCLHGLIQLSAAAKQHAGKLRTRDIVTSEALRSGADRLQLAVPASLGELNDQVEVNQLLRSVDGAAILPLAVRAECKLLLAQPTIQHFLNAEWLGPLLDEWVHKTASPRLFFLRSLGLAALLLPQLLLLPAVAIYPALQRRLAVLTFGDLCLKRTFTSGLAFATDRPYLLDVPIVKFSISRTDGGARTLDCSNAPRPSLTTPRLFEPSHGQRPSI